MHPKRLIFLFLLAISGLFFARVAFAQFEGLPNPLQIKDGDILVNVVPETPGPNQNVTLTLSSYATNLNKATITWSMGGKIQLDGIGEKTFSFTTGNIGTKTEITIAIIINATSRVDKKIIIEPSQVDLLWEAPGSYTPPFYRGKALPAQESVVQVVAMPVDSDGIVRPTTKVYNWKKDFKVDQFNSGYGKYSYSVRNSYLNRTDTVSLNFSSLSGGGGENTLTINYEKPRLLFYEKNPSVGVLYNTLLNKGFPLSKGEMTLHVAPFFFSTEKGVTGKQMTYLWTINGQSISAPTPANELTVRGSTQAGLAKVNLSLTNTLTLFQEAQQNLSITLGQK